jgi:hypothetical protein
MQKSVSSGDIKGSLEATGKGNAINGLRPVQPAST